MAFGFDQHALDQIIAVAPRANTPSLRVMERLGMRFVEAARANGLPIVFYRIERDEWKARRDVVVGGPQRAGAASADPVR